MFTINYLSNILGLRIIQSSLRRVGKGYLLQPGQLAGTAAGFCVRRVCSDRRDRRDAYGFEISFKD